MSSDLIYRIESEFDDSECLDNIFRPDVPNDEFYQCIKKIFIGKNSSELRMTDWSNLGFPSVITRRYLNIESYIFVIKPIIIESVQTNFFYLALELILPDNQKIVAKGQWWELFKRNLNGRQREVLRSFLQYVVIKSPEESEDRVHAQIAINSGIFL